MRPLNIVAFAVGVVPVLAFLLVVVLSDGAPFRPPAGEESRPGAAAPELPHRTPMRHDSAAASGSRAPIAGRAMGVSDVLMATKTAPQPNGVIDPVRDATVFRALFSDAAAVPDR